jgi:hypothetical protein
MSVGEQLGLDGNSDLLDQARGRWAEWVARDARLAMAPRFDDLRGYLRGASTEEADQCLLALARLAAADGGDDPAAAAALAKALLPGASVLAGRLTMRLSRRLPPVPARRVDELVASQLWLEVRTFPWQRLTKVGGNILLNTQAAVLRDCGDRAVLERADPTWARTVCLDPAVAAEARSASSVLSRPGAGLVANPVYAAAAGDADSEPSAREELLAVLEWACARQVISLEDRALLLCLVDEAARTPSRSARRGKAGLCGNAVSATVALRLGTSAATVRRRAAATMAALAAAAPHGFAA